MTDQQSVQAERALSLFRMARDARPRPPDARMAPSLNEEQADALLNYVDELRSALLAIAVPLTDERIEQLAIEHEDFGFGRVDDYGISTHGFNPKGLRDFARAIESEVKGGGAKHG